MLTEATRQYVTAKAQAAIPSIAVRSTVSWPALVTHGEALSILGVCEPSSAADADVVKLASHRRGCLGGPRRHALGQLAQLGKHTLRTAARGCVTSVEVAACWRPISTKPHFCSTSSLGSRRT
ncbi:MAG: hypothetical protein JWQ32_3586 [Marmoricola sp.]|nr:hypothetical protein [Marmoricola sp.]